jgi:hypothetical protein
MSESYLELITEEKEKDQQLRTAIDILEGLNRIISSGDKQARRRWFWELLQNACDVTPPDRDARIEVELNQDSNPNTLAFRHNGSAFTHEDLVRLTHQNSNKRKWSNREKNSVERRPESIGRFGTGFLTTHLLSRKVEVKGIIHNEGKKPKKFNVPLDRTGETPEELQEGVKKAFDALNDIKDSPVVEDYKPGRLNTTFLYHLDSRGVKVAQEGVDEADQLLPYVMAFNQRIHRADIPYPSTGASPHHGISHVLQGKEVIGETENASVQVVRLTRIGEKKESTRRIAVVRGERAALAFPVRREDNEITVLPLGDDVPRLFCGFPLIGTSRFPLPVVVNSTHFHPTEKRNGIRLTDSEQEKPTENRHIFEEVTKLYQCLVEIATDQEWNDLFHLADVGEPDGISHISESWYSNQVVDPIHSTLSRQPIVEVANGERKPLKKDEDNCAHIPVDSTKEAREAYWELRVSHQADVLPSKNDIHEWYDLSSRYNCYRAGDLTVCAFVGRKETLDELAGSIKKSKEATIDWLEELYEYIIDHGDKKYFDVYTDRRRKGNEESHPILINQNFKFEVKSNIYFDEEIPEGLKDIASLLGKEYRDVLLHKDLAPDLALGTLSDNDVADEITSRVEDRLGQTGERSEETRRVFRKLLNWFDENPVYAEELFGGLYENKHRLRTDEEARRDRQKAQRYDDIQHQVREHGFSSTEELLRHLEQEDTEGETPDEGTGDEDGSDSEARAEIIEIVMDRGIKTPEELDEADRRDPELFSHIPERSLEKFRQFLSMLSRVKEAVRGHLEEKPEYDVDSWTDHEAYPTVVSVRKHGRPIYLVLRPADQNKVIFYESMELDTLELSTAELWVQTPDKRPVRLTSGHVLRAVGVEPQTGIRLPPDIFPKINLDELTRGRDSKDD